MAEIREGGQGHPIEHPAKVKNSMFWKWQIEIFGEGMFIVVQPQTPSFVGVKLTVAWRNTVK